jgi:midasin (ATPase involved in ribosome maturation)
MDHSRRCGRGVYNIQEIVCIDDAPAEENEVAAEYTATASVLAMTNGDRTTIIPDVCKEYVPWGNFEDIKALINIKEFVTIYVTGLSGNGKTTMIEQVCANLKRECFRVNIVGTTDEDDLFGGLRLVNGSTVWEDGAVIQAMKRGAVLLLDEVDLGSEKLMCLQPVLEGKGVYIKKKNEWVTPAKGFCVVATANTKGKGSDDGRFVGTNIMNEAFLDRFDYTYEQEYAPKNVEKKIIVKMMNKYGIADDKFADHLVLWAEMIRKSYADGAVTEIISTRRLINIVKAFSVFNNKQKSVSMSLARFDSETQDAFMSLYRKIDGDMNPPQDAAQKPKEESPDATPPWEKQA